MKFKVIDNKTGKEADTWNIALNEEWAQSLIYCDMEGFAITEDGNLVLMDECGHVVYCDTDRFKVVFEEERPHGEWVEVKRYNRKGKRFLDCSVCHYGEKGEIVCEVTKLPNFCPNCGASMVKEGEAE